MRNFKAHVSSLGQRGLFHRLKWWMLRHRRLCIAALLCACVGLTVQAFIPHTPNNHHVVVAAKELVPGEEIQLSDLRLASVPATLIPDHALTDIHQGAGKRVSATLAPGSVLSTTSFVGPGLLSGLPSNMAAVPVAPTDPRVLSLLRPGAHVDVYLNPDNGFTVTEQPQLAVSRAIVLWVEERKSGGVLDSQEESGLVVLGVPQDRSAALVAAGRSQQTQVVLVD